MIAAQHSQNHLLTAVLDRPSDMIVDTASPQIGPKSPGAAAEQNAERERPSATAPNRLNRLTRPVLTS